MPENPGRWFEPGSTGACRVAGDSALHSPASRRSRHRGGGAVIRGAFDRPGAEFLRAVDVCFEEMRRSPERFPQIYKSSRRVLLRRFPYAAYFVSTATGIQVKLSPVCT